MKFQGNLSIARPVEKVWEFLWDVEKLIELYPRLRKRQNYQGTGKV